MDKKYYKVVAGYKGRYWSACTCIEAINTYTRLQHSHSKGYKFHLVEYRPGQWTLKRSVNEHRSHGLLYVFDNLDNAKVFERYSLLNLFFFSIWECEVRNPISSPGQISSVKLVSGVKLIKKVY